MHITTLNTAKANGQGFGHIQRANTLARFIE
jgi:spore coat polysaccharide biosynthesis predicted glycosyltransferase SpsG